MVSRYVFSFFFFTYKYSIYTILYSIYILLAAGSAGYAGAYPAYPVAPPLVVCRSSGACACPSSFIYDKFIREQLRKNGVRLYDHHGHATDHAPHVFQAVHHGVH